MERKESKATSSLGPSLLSKWRSGIEAPGQGCQNTLRIVEYFVICHDKVAFFVSCLFHWKSESVLKKKRRNSIMFYAFDTLGTRGSLEARFREMSEAEGRPTGRRPATSGKAAIELLKECLDLPCWMDLDPSNPIKIKLPVIT